MTQYKNPFEDPEADLYGKKVKDYKIVERKEESKPAEPLEEKVELDPAIISRYEKEIRGLRDEKPELKKSMLFGYGTAFISSTILTLLAGPNSLATFNDPSIASTNLFLYYMMLSVLGIFPGIIGLVSTAKAIINSKKSKGLEKKIKELKK